jgi:hypothetical protein
MFAPKNEDLEPGSQVIAFAGPYLIRRIDKINPRTGNPHILPFAARVAVNNAFLDFPGLQDTFIHELAHGLGL